MKNLSRIYFLSAILLLLVGIALFSSFAAVSSQETPLTHVEIQNTLRNPPPANFTKVELIEALIELIKKRKVDKPLTDDREVDLRDAGAFGKVPQSLIDKVVETVRQNIKPTPSPTTPTPTPTPSPVTPTPSPTVALNSLGMEFVLIKAGSFMMGSPASEVLGTTPFNESRVAREEVQHRVTISRDFYMGTHEITQGQWKAIMGNNPSNFQKCGDKCPVELVSWYDVQQFISKLNSMGGGTYRLPTEAECEYAARGGKDGDPFGIGDGKNLSSNLANFQAEFPYGNGEPGIPIGGTVEVFSYKPNSWGLYNMHGNVREWCFDWFFEEYQKDKKTDPTGPVAPINGDLKVYRGGGFASPGHGVRSGNRERNTPSAKSSSVGFRLVKEN